MKGSCLRSSGAQVGAQGKRRPREVGPDIGGNLSPAAQRLGLVGDIRKEQSTCPARCNLTNAGLVDFGESRLTDPESTNTQPRQQIQQILTASRRLWQNVRPWLWQLTTAALLIAITLLVVRPFAPPPNDPSADDIQKQWNDSISRLGIEPIFPPEEDFYVGDIWAVISGGPSNGAFLGKAVRIGQVDMRSYVERVNGSVPVFADTKTGAPGAELPLQDNKESDSRANDKHIYLTVAAFPGVTITHVTKASTFFGLTIGGTAADRDGLQVEETKMPYAETYGVPTDVAIGALDEWCAAKETSYICTYKFACSMLSYGLGMEALGSADGEDKCTISDQNGKGRLTINITMVSRVFLTRELDSRRVTSNVRGGALHIVPAISAKPEHEALSITAGTLPADAKPEDGVKNSIDAQGAELRSEAGLSNSGGASFQQSDENSVGLRQIFPRPVVFGFRSVSILAPDSE
jgi:hypothetical protein